MELRIRGKVIQEVLEDGSLGKYYFKLRMKLPEVEDVEEEVWAYSSKDSFDSLEGAREEMLRVAREASNHVRKFFDMEASDGYVDMKEGGFLRPWDTH